MKKFILHIFVGIVVCTMFSTTALAKDDTAAKKAKSTLASSKTAAVQKGLYEKDGAWYYGDPSGKLLKGAWHDANGKRYYFGDDGKAFVGLRTVKTESGSHKYFFDTKTAVMQKSEWNVINGKQYYSRYNGIIATNAWISEKYYCDQKGEKVFGLYTIDGNKYYFNTKTGVKQTGWISKKYYAKADGQLYRNTVVKISNKYYGFDNSGKKMTGLRTVDGNRYFFKSSGAAKTGWISSKGKKYYANKNGKLVKNWKKIGKYYYYFKPSNCSMAKNTTVEGYKVDSKGRRGMATVLAKMYNKARSQTSQTKYIVIVDRANHKVAIFKGKKDNWKKVKYFSCTNGKPSTPTISGTFTAGNKGYYFDSGAARCYWFTQISGGYLFHSVLYTHSGQLSDGRVGMALSHGCVRLKKANAKWIYDHIPRGTKIIIY